MREILSTTALVVGRGMNEGYAPVTDDHFFGATHGSYVDHMSPKVVSGDPIELMENGDVIETDTAGRGLHLKVSQEGLERREMTFIPMRGPREPILAKYAALVSSTSTGIVINVTEL